jgi:hypothetical protein
MQSTFSVKIHCRDGGPFELTAGQVSRAAGGLKLAGVTHGAMPDGLYEWVTVDWVELGEDKQERLKAADVRTHGGEVTIAPHDGSV